MRKKSRREQGGCEGTADGGQRVIILRGGLSDADRCDLSETSIIPLAEALISCGLVVAFGELPTEQYQK